MFVSSSHDQVHKTSAPKMSLAMLNVLTLAMGLASFSVMGSPVVPDAETDVAHRAASIGLSALSRMRAASGNGISLAKPQSPALNALPVVRAAAYDQCRVSVVSSLESLLECDVSDVDNSGCTTGTTDGMSSSQGYVCPDDGGCCLRLILDDAQDLHAAVVDGVFLNGERLIVDTTKCPPCVILVDSDLTCESIAVPDDDAPAGEEVECADSSTKKVDPDGEKCFPADAYVELEHGGVVRMDALSIGDSLKVGPNTFSKVFMFTHKMSDVSVDFLLIRTVSGASLSLTHGHYIYANNALVAAGSVAVGDELMLGDGGRSTVTSVSHVPSRGLYNPQTLNGDIVVNGVLASTYTTAVDPGFAHFVLSPLRALSRFGLSYTGLESGGDRVASYAPGGLETIV